MSDTVLISASEGVATITLNRPDALNSLTTELKETLLDALRQGQMAFMPSTTPEALE